MPMSAAGDKLSAWSNPGVITNAWEFGKGHDNSTKLPDMKFWLMDKIKPENATDEAVVMAYVARKIVDHGGYFCTTQLRSRNIGTSKCPKIWTSYQNPDGDVDRTCFWLCEPGYSGEGCKSGKAASADSCNYTKLSKDSLTKDANIEYNQTGDWDRNEVETLMRQNDNQGFFVFGHGNKKKGNESDVILVAKSFLENGHGIVASPATFTAHGGQWDDTFYSEWLDCKAGKSNLSLTDVTGGYKTKTLCMPGFDGDECASTHCQNCDDPLTKFNSTTGSCSDCIENHIRGDDGKCTPCGAGETAVDQKICLKCKDTEYILDGACAPRLTVSETQLRLCYPNETPSDYTACMMNTCETGHTVGCITDGKVIGKKTCANGKWGPCRLEAKK